MRFVLVAAKATGLSSAFIPDLENLLHSHRFAISARESLSRERVLRLQLTLPTVHEEAPWKLDLIQLSDKHQTDIAIIPEDKFNSSKKLAVFDMDSTLICQEVIDEMAIRFGLGDQVKAITVRAMNGELNFDQSLSMRVSLLKGLPLRELDEVKKSLTFTPGVPELIAELKKSGIRTVIASGGFTFFAEHVRSLLNMDESYANVLSVEQETLTGTVSGEIVNASFKASLLHSLARREHISMDQIIAVGDGANDIPMLLTAGLGFAFHAKEKVRREAPHQLHHGKMNVLLYFLNIPGDHFR
jgi:phosphoserine phosphatase